MATVSDELVERVAEAITSAGNGESKTKARAAIAALSTPEFVLPLAEELLRELGGYDTATEQEFALFDAGGVRIAAANTLLGAYRAAKGE